MHFVGEEQLIDGEKVVGRMRAVVEALGVSLLFLPLRCDRVSPILTQQGPYTLHPTPYTQHPTPHALHPAPCALHPTPCTLHPASYTLHSTPLHSTPDTPHPTSCTLHPAPYTLHLTSRTPQHTPCALRHSLSSNPR